MPTEPQGEDTTLTRTITFGKYRGATFQQIADRDPDYGWWLVMKADNLREDVREELGEYLQEQSDPFDDDQDWSIFHD